ncbi:hypothetical protein MUK42_37076 [Musa troglodytarum]|uniref:Uncharacterized protein n=1 Tax=Musa troglodytarum TaxID=320322 RepID=A0A9E7FI87_9LILI|nr:hypothetical protein MUK42_37076 [Musa troglodytarum]
MSGPFLVLVHKIGNLNEETVKLHRAMMFQRLVHSNSIDTILLDTRRLSGLQSHVIEELIPIAILARLGEHFTRETAMMCLHKHTIGSQLDLWSVLRRSVVVDVGCLHF